MEKHFFGVVWSFDEPETVLESSDEPFHEGPATGAVAAAAAVAVGQTMLHLHRLSYQLLCPLHLIQYYFLEDCESTKQRDETMLVSGQWSAKRSGYDILVHTRNKQWK